MEKQELKNLTPEMVEELRELGIQFEDIQCVHSFDEEYLGTDMDGDPIMRTLNTYTLYTNTESELCDITHPIPAPNLQNVLDKLPTAFYVEHGLYSGVKGFFLNLYPVGNIADRHWVVAYTYPNEPNKISFSNINPLIAAFELLKWVAINHPENVIKNESTTN